MDLGRTGLVGCTGRSVCNLLVAPLARERGGDEDGGRDLELALGGRIVRGRDHVADRVRLAEAKGDTRRIEVGELDPGGVGEDEAGVPRPSPQSHRQVDDGLPHRLAPLFGVELDLAPGREGLGERGLPAVLPVELLLEAEELVPSFGSWEVLLEHHLEVEFRVLLWLGCDPHGRGHDLGGLEGSDGTRVGHGVRHEVLIGHERLGRGPGLHGALRGDLVAILLGMAASHDFTGPHENTSPCRFPDICARLNRDG